MKLTVFTPTFNRGYTIDNLYRSLQRQSFMDFEWLVIDDGSRDNTEELFKSWLKDKNAFQMRYYKFDNGGKHRAINKAVDLAYGELFFIVDSDDYLTEDALESVVAWEKSLEREKVFCGVAGNRGKSKNQLWGTTHDKEYLDATTLERKKYNINGDKAEIFYTEIMKKYKFPEFKGEKFITECTVWDKMAFEGYKIRWFNKIIYISDYLDDGLTKSGDKIFADNPQGTAYMINQQIQFNKYNLKDRMSSYNAYYNLVKHNIDIKQAANYLEINRAILISIIALIRCKSIVFDKRWSF